MSLVLSPPALAIAPETRVGFAAGLAAAAIWGAYLALSSAGVAAGLNGYDVAALRYMVAGPIMLGVLVLRREGLRLRMSVLQGVTVAVLLGPPFVLLSVGGYAFAPLAHGSVLVPASLTLGGLALSRVVLGERLGLQRLVGVGIMLLGLGLVVGRGASVSAAAIGGDAMFVLAGLSWAAFAALQQRWRLPAVDVTAVVGVAGLVALVPGYLVLRGTDALAALPAGMLAAQIVVQGILSGVVAMIAFAASVRLLGAARAATFPALVPGFALVIGLPLTGQALVGSQAIGLVALGLGLVSVLGAARMR
ncbi:DMT family transporter [Sulfitobacter sp. S190]|uniref:DMT family transporter n=1 Tax=Sulfitobacter sp. S190 TaxID=2867022 RepID=UPI0021A738E3|nr:DMT family transporter [Sulfitobacter sp. S190]UWR23444.1 DMT family transporter [Sulfitobacter sp. S190]